MDWQYDKCLQIFRKSAILETIEKGVMLPRDKVFFLEEGNCSLAHFTEDGEESLHLYFRPGVLLNFLVTIIGDMDFTHLTENKVPQLTHHIHTSSPCVFHTMSGKKFIELLDKEPILYKLLCKSLSENLINSIDLSTNLAAKPAPMRICRLLLDFSIPEAGKQVLGQRMTYGEISSYLAMHKITVTKVFNTLFKKGIIVKEGSKVILSDAKQLEKLASGEETFSY